MAIALFTIGIVEIVLIRELLSGADVAQSRNEDPPLVFFRLTVWFATMVKKHGGTEAVYDRIVFAEAEEVGYRTVLVTLICFRFAVPEAIVLTYLLAFANRAQGIAASGMNRRRSDNQL